MDGRAGSDCPNRLGVALQSRQSATTFDSVVELHPELLVGSQVSGTVA